MILFMAYELMAAVLLLNLMIALMMAAFARVSSYKGLRYLIYNADALRLVPSFRACAQSQPPVNVRDKPELSLERNEHIAVQLDERTAAPCGGSGSQGGRD
ncbi:hypothetical protein Vafri_8987 [Volvox africanus]|uniref:Uncharacterized protein n=1 Tax=Volvox africanus TaxID=51714 RepID=A0A8J4EYI4_9CHLO|nr:hypothetical protein Vafri_8987 [Volvox africanus]